MPIKIWTYIPTARLSQLRGEGRLREEFLICRDRGFLFPEETIEGIDEFEFQYNPENVILNKEAHWVEKDAPGLEQPTLHWLRDGPCIFPLSLFLENDIEGPPPGRSEERGLTECRLFFQGLLKPLDSQQRPPYIDLIFGEISRRVVVVTLSITILSCFPWLEPRTMNVDLTLKEWGDPGT